ncbi:MAG: MFS transporter [Myxococcota bacterium]|nr:MFS transporter [Myxococcota bacterium]
MRIGSVSISLLIATALTLVGNALLSTLAAVRLADAGVPEARGGLILACYFAGITLGTQLLVPTIRRVGNARAFAAATGLAVAAALAHGLVPPGLGWAALRGVTGVAMAGVYMTLESWLNADAAPEQRGRVMAAYLVALYLGGTLGQLILPVWPSTGIEAFAFAALAVSLSMIPVALTRTPQPDLELADPIPARALLRVAPLGWGAAWVSGFVSAVIYASIPLSERAAGQSAEQVSALMTAFVLGGFAGQWPIGRLSDRIDRRGVLMGVAALVSLGCAALPLAATAPPGLRFVLAFGFGALSFSIYPLSVAHTLDRVGAERALPAASATLLASAVGAVAGPVAASSATAWLGPAALYGLVAVFTTALALCALSRWIRIAPVEQEAFLPVPRTTAVAYELDPRAEGDEADAAATADSTRDSRLPPRADPGGYRTPA